VHSAFSVLGTSFLHNSPDYSVVDMNHTRDQNSSTVSRNHPTKSNVPAALGNLDDISVLPLTDQKKTQIITSPAGPHESEDSHLPVNGASMMDEVPNSPYRSTNQKTRLATRRGWAPLKASICRKWDTAVNTRTIWPRFVYGMVGLLLIVIWIGIT
jgi:hypothetical protein